MSRFATRVRTTARGLDVEVCPTRAVCVIFAPNGAGKSTLLNAIPHALNGSIFQGGKTVAAPQLVWDAFYVGAGEFRTRIDFGDGTFVDRTMRGVDDGEGGVRTTMRVTSPLAAGLTGKAADGALIAALGNPAHFNVAAFLSLTPGQRQERSQAMCAAVAAPWPEQKVVDVLAAEATSISSERSAAIQAAAWGRPVVDGANLYRDGETCYDALQRHLAQTEEAARKCSSERTKCQQAIERLDADAARAPATVHGTADFWEQACTRLNGEIERLNRELGEAEANRTRRASVDGEIERMRELSRTPINGFQADVDTAQKTLTEARARLLKLQTEPSAPWADSPELAELTRERDAARAALEELEALRRPLRLEHDALDVVLKRLATAMQMHASIDDHADAGDGQPAECPMCRGAITPEHVESLKARHEELAALLAESAADLSRRETAVRYAQADLEDAEAENRASREAWVRADAAHTADVRDLGQQTGPGGALEKNVEYARGLLAQRKGVAERLGTLEKERQAIPPADVEALATSLDGATAERDAAVTNRRAVAESAERARTRARALADREDMDAKLPALENAVRCWKVVIAAYVYDSTKPLLTVVNRVVAAGWSVEYDPEHAMFRVRRPRRPSVPLSSLSDGEQAGIFPAFVAAFANATRAGWRLVLADGAEAMQSTPTDGAPHGMLVRTVEGLVAAAEAGEYDQAFVATARLSPEEEMAIVAAGAEVVRLGSSELTDDHAVAIRHAVDALTAAGVRALYEWMGEAADDNLPVARAMAATHAIAHGRSASEVIAHCATLPQRANRTTTEAGATPEVTT